LLGDAGKPFLTNQPGQLSLASVGVSKWSTSFSCGKHCDPIWHVSSRSDKAFAQTAIEDFTFTGRQYNNDVKLPNYSIGSVY